MRRRKLTHILHSCQTCRRRKIRCDGRRPHCSTCEQNRHECLGYAAPPVPTVEEDKEDDIKKDSGDEKEKHRSVKNSPLRPTPRPPLGGGSSDSTIKRLRRDSRESPTLEPPLLNRSPLVKAEDDEPSSSQIVNRTIPIFRFFGPTAIVKGYKQMVVTVREPRRSLGPTSLSSGESFRRFIKNIRC